MQTNDKNKQHNRLVILKLFHLHTQFSCCGEEQPAPISRKARGVYFLSPYAAIAHLGHILFTLANVHKRDWPHTTVFHRISHSYSSAPLMCAPIDPRATGRRMPV